MEKVIIEKYKALDGSLWFNEKDALTRDKHIEWEKNIPEEMHIIRNLFIKFFENNDKKDNDYLKSFAEESITIAKTETYLSDEYSSKPEYKIEMNFSCSNRNYTKVIGEFIVLLSNLPNGFISFNKHNISFNTYLETGTKDDIKFLKQNIK